MKSLSELLGFAVLTGPLWLILVLLPVGIWIAWKLAKRFTRGSTRLAVGLGVFLLFFCVPFADEIAGRIYFNHLCATEAGVKVYRAIELPAEYWDGNGNPRFFNKHGFLDHKLWVEKLDESSGHVERYSTIFGIDKNISLVKDRSSQKVLAEVATFRYWGGWVSRNFSPNSTASSCEFIRNSNFSRGLYSQLFKSVTSSKIGGDHGND